MILNIIISSYSIVLGFSLLDTAQNLVVKTNLFQIDPLSTWTQYKMDFVLLEGTKYADRESWRSASEVQPERVSRMQSKLEKYGSTEFTRKICQLLCQQVQRELNTTSPTRIEYFARGT